MYPPCFSEKGLTGVSDISFHTATVGCASSRHSILRLWRAPSSRTYTLGAVSLLLSYRYVRYSIQLSRQSVYLPYATTSDAFALGEGRGQRPG